MGFLFLRNAPIFFSSACDLPKAEFVKKIAVPTQISGLPTGGWHEPTNGQYCDGITEGGGTEYWNVDDCMQLCESTTDCDFITYYSSSASPAWRYRCFTHTTCATQTSSFEASIYQAGFNSKKKKKTNYK